MKYENDEWVPAKDVEMKVGIQRLWVVFFLQAMKKPILLIQPGTVTCRIKKRQLAGRSEREYRIGCQSGRQ